MKPSSVLKQTKTVRSYTFSTEELETALRVAYPEIFNGDADFRWNVGQWVSLDVKVTTVDVNEGS